MRATSVGDASAGPASSGPDDSAPTPVSEDTRTRASGQGEFTDATDTTPTTAEEAMDDAGAGDGFVDESAYSSTDH